MKKFLNNILEVFRHPLGLSLDRSFSKGFSKQVGWLLLILMIAFGLLWLVSLIAGVYTPGKEDSHGRIMDILFVLVDPGSGASSMSAGFVIVCAVAGLIVFTGMLISFISNILERRVENHAKGVNNYRAKNHVVILGFNKSVPTLLNKIRATHPASHILLMTDQDVEQVRNWIHANSNDSVESYLILMSGSRNSNDNLKRLHFNNKVKEIYILGEENEPDHDAISLDCVKKIARMLPIEKDSKEKVECHVQIESSTVFSTLQTVDFAKELVADGKMVKDCMVFAPYNMNEIWAQKAIGTIPIKRADGEYEYRPLDGEGITAESDKHVHLIIVGMNDMSRSLAVNAAHIMHFPNYREGDFASCSHVTFIDREAFARGREFRNQYRNLFALSRWRAVMGDECADSENGWTDEFAADEFAADEFAANGQKYKHLGDVNFMDIVWEFIEGDVFEDSLQDYLMRCAENEKEITTIAICGDDTRRNAKLCMALPDELCEKANSIIVRQEESSLAVDIISKMPNKNGHIKSFGMTNECYSENLMSDRYGKYINLVYEEEKRKEEEKTKEGKKDTDENMVADKNLDADDLWDKCEILDKWSSNHSANMLFVKLRSLGFRDEKELSKEALENVTNDNVTFLKLCRTEHNRWNTERLLLGFRFLTEEEQKFLTDLDKLDKKEKELKKKEWKKENKKHLDIVSNDRLLAIDPTAPKNDANVNRRLWDIYCEFNKKRESVSE